MILEFESGKKLTIQRVTGGHQLIYGAMRDVLNIEISPSDHKSIDNIRKVFLENLSEHLTIINENNEENVLEGYQIFLSIEDKMVEIKSNPSTIGPMKIKETYIVSIAQLTYLEKIFIRDEKKSLNDFFLQE